MENRFVTVPSETERYIRFQLEQLTARNEHHGFEGISFRIAERRLSSNLLPATGPVSAGGDQGRDAESYYTRLPEELPGAGGFVGRATAEPLVVACTVQKSGLEAKIRSDLQSICGQGGEVSRVAFFAVQEVPVAARHRLQEHARETHGVNLEIFDGQSISHMLAQADLVWVAQRWLDLPSTLLPDDLEDPQPDWYTQTLAALRGRETKRLTPGALSEVRDGLRHATFDADARVDLPEWLRYVREFIDEAAGDDVVAGAQYESAVATLRGLNTLDGVEGDIRAVIDYALAADTPSAVEDAGVLLMYWGGAWSRHLGAVTPEELSELNLRLREHVQNLLDTTLASTHPVRTARLLASAAQLCLHPRWTEVERPPAGVLPTPQETTLMTRAAVDAGEAIVLEPGDVPLDVAEALTYLHQLAEVLPKARAFPLGNVSQMFEMCAPMLADDPRYEAVRDALDAADAAIGGDGAVAHRSRGRAVAFRRAGRPLDALRELHSAKISWWHGDTLRGSLLTMRVIAGIYAELRMLYAAKQYALAVAAVASSSGEPDLQDLVAEAFIDAMDYAYVAGNWADALALAHVAVLAHGVLAENAFDYDDHPSLQRLEFNALMVLLAAEHFRPDALPVLREALGETGFERNVSDLIEEVRPSFGSSEQEFAAQAHDQLAGRPFSDLGPRRTLTFAALGTAWWVSCTNDQRSVLAAERFVAAAQIVLVELAQADPVFLTQDVHVDLLVGTPFGSEGNVTFKPNNDAVDCTVVLSPITASSDPEWLGQELGAVVIQLLAHLSVGPQDEFMAAVEQAFEAGLVHKIHVGRPYDELASVLDQAHYNAISAVSIEPLKGSPFHPFAADHLAAPTTAGPRYDHDIALANIQETYEYLPSLLSQTLPRALADPATVAGFHELRREGWLDWHLLIAIHNAALNVRAAAAGLLARPNVTAAEQGRLAREPETERSAPIPLSAFTPARMRSMMDGTILAIGQRRWRLGAAQTPNLTAFRELLTRRYGFGEDDVPHRDLLTEALAEDGSLQPLLDSAPSPDD